MAKIVMKKVIIFIIKTYRYLFNTCFGPVCRFTPTCSEYAITALTIHGFTKGCYYTVARLLRCHPWCAGGMDPVPQPKEVK